jgi:hypothetical protein
MKREQTSSQLNKHKKNNPHPVARVINSRRIIIAPRDMRPEKQA